MHDEGECRSRKGKSSGLEGYFSELKNYDVSARWNDIKRDTGEYCDQLAIALLATVLGVVSFVEWVLRTALLGFIKLNFVVLLIFLAVLIAAFSTSSPPATKLDVYANDIRETDRQMRRLLPRLINRPQNTLLHHDFIVEADSFIDTHREMDDLGIPALDQADNVYSPLSHAFYWPFFALFDRWKGAFSCEGSNGGGAMPYDNFEDRYLYFQVGSQGKLYDKLVNAVKCRQSEIRDLWAKMDNNRDPCTEMSFMKIMDQIIQDDIRRVNSAQSVFDIYMLVAIVLAALSAVTDIFKDSVFKWKYMSPSSLYDRKWNKISEHA
jgi:hypothetical protein